MRIPLPRLGLLPENFGEVSANSSDHLPLPLPPSPSPSLQGSRRPAHGGGAGSVGPGGRQLLEGLIFPLCAHIGQQGDDAGSPFGPRSFRDGKRGVPRVPPHHAHMHTLVQAHLADHSSEPRGSSEPRLAASSGRLGLTDEVKPPRRSRPILTQKTNSTLQFIVIWISRHSKSEFQI